ncbi:hypothetical protein ABE42_41420 [Bacillus thuringiensis]|nr:hypothetical protein [Bacillus thuringiensis]
MEKRIKRFWCKIFKIFENALPNLVILVLRLKKRCVISMEKENMFKWKHYQPDIILGSGAKRFEELQVISQPWTY